MAVQTKIINSTSAKVLIFRINHDYVPNGYRIIRLWYEIRLIRFKELQRNVTVFFAELSNEPQVIQKPRLIFNIGPVMDQIIPNTEV